MTPFGLHAMQRRAAAVAGNTPGRDRRKSGRGIQRETAFDVLKNLGKGRWLNYTDEWTPSSNTYVRPYIYTRIVYIYIYI